MSGTRTTGRSVAITDYSLESYGAQVGLYNRVEFSAARQTLDTEKVGKALGVGRSFKIKQNILGLKVRLLGDAVLEQDSWAPQLAIGLQFKENSQGATVKSLGAEDDQGIDFYLSATKIILSQSLLANLTVRRTRANQLGLLGFGGDRDSSYEILPEASLAYLVTNNLAVGVEYRAKPNNLKVAKEDDWSDIFLAWAPTKNISLTLAYTALGQIATRDNQSGIYSSLQIGF